MASAGDFVSPQPRRPASGSTPRPVPSYAQPKHLNRRQPPILEQVRNFVEEFGSKPGGAGDDRLCTSSYYTGQLMTAASMANGIPSSGDLTTRMIKQQREQARLLANLSNPKSTKNGNNQSGVAKNVRQLRERMHRATQGLPTTPLPSKLLQAFGARDPSVEPDSVEDNALSWLGLRKMKKCGLCDVMFPVVTLVTSVSVKALVHLRKDWSDRRGTGTSGASAVGRQSDDDDEVSPSTLHGGIRAAAESKSRVPAHAYNETRVCRFCAQFFGVFLGERFEEDDPVAPQSHHRVEGRGHTNRASTMRQPHAIESSSSSSESSTSDDEVDDGDGGNKQKTSNRPQRTTSSSNSSIASSVSSRSTTPRSQRSTSRSSRDSRSPPTKRQNPNEGPKSIARLKSIKALEKPVREVMATRSSLLRRTHHHYVKQELDLMAREDSRDIAVVQKRSKAATKAADLALRPHPVCQEFVLGPTSSDEEVTTRPPRPTSSASSHRLHPSTRQTTPPPADRHESTMNTESSTFTPLSDRPAYDGQIFHDEDGSTLDEGDVEQQAAALFATTTSTNTTGGRTIIIDDAQWASGQVHVLVMCCNSYPNRLAMPAAMPHLATRVAHWSSQVFYNPDAAGDNVRILQNDDVTPRAVGAFLQDCAAARAAPLMLFFGLVEHAEGRFGDAILQTTAPNDSSSAKVGPSAWPEHCRQWLNSAPPSSQSKSSKRRTTSTPPIQPRHASCSVNPLEPSTTSSVVPTTPAMHGGSAAPIGVSVLDIDGVCEGLKLPRPTLVIDCCFGPLVVSTKSMLVIHPTRPTPAIAVGPRGATSNAAIASGQVVDALTSFVERSIRQRQHQIRRIPGMSSAVEVPSVSPFSCTWAHITTKLFNDAQVGVVAQEMFHRHIKDDTEMRPFVITAPLLPNDKGEQPHLLAVPWSNIKFGDAPSTLQLPSNHSVVGTAPSSDTQQQQQQQQQQVSSSGPLWFPSESTLVELHRDLSQSQQAAASSSGATTRTQQQQSIWATVSMNDDLLQSVASRVSQTFCLRLHPRMHNTQRMAATGSQRCLADALRVVLQREVSTQSLIDNINFNISVVLSGHVAVFLSSEDQGSVQQAAAVVTKHLAALQNAGFHVVDYGFVVARSNDSPFSLASLTDNISASSSIVVLDVHVA
ncbi:Hypothetical protein, putative [Bodo saltans]|uniref:Uncharacterized protein n=1 Tax=Bodo saltans TaxID=75058 RepID=A0A0S4JS87_BODSA|nr:Hypothetical protein, putative [Bodo saltans]|eukprot:CUG93087.1 Hypothetical protein, putative [Bodo saltans]